MTTTPARTQYSRAVIGTVIGGLVANVLLTVAYATRGGSDTGSLAVGILGTLWVAWVVLLVVAVRARFSERAVKFASTLGGLCVAVAVASYFLVFA